MNKKIFYHIFSYIIFYFILYILLNIFFNKKKVYQHTTKETLYTCISAIFYIPILEEIIFRGYLYKFLKLYTSTYTAIFLSSLLFGLAHIGARNKGNLVIFTVCFFHGLFFGISNHISNCILYPISLHSIGNLMYFLIR